MLYSIANEVGPAPDPPVRVGNGEPSNELTDANAQAPLLLGKRPCEPTTLCTGSEPYWLKRKPKTVTPLHPIAPKLGVVMREYML